MDSSFFFLLLYPRSFDPDSRSLVAGRTTAWPYMLFSLFQPEGKETKTKQKQKQNQQKESQCIASS